MKRISRNFDISARSKAGSILRPLHYKSMGEKWKFPRLHENHSAHPATSGYRSNWHPESEYCDWWPLVKWKITSSFSVITFNRRQLEQWQHHRCVQDDDTDRLICNMTFSDRVMTLTRGQVFKMTFQGKIICHSTRLDTRNTMLAKSMSCLYWIKIYYSKTFFA